MEQVRKVWDQKLEEVVVSALQEPVRITDTLILLSAGQDGAEFHGEEEEVGLSEAVVVDGLAEPSRLICNNSILRRMLLKQLNS